MDRKLYRTAVHMTHCCKAHGCKYTNWLPEAARCPVVTGEVEQAHPCEWCDESKAELAELLAERARFSPSSSDTPDELLHKLREGVATHWAQTLDEDDTAQLLHDLVRVADELDRQMTNGRPLPGAWTERRA